MVQRIDLTGRVFNMLKENNLMIEESQHSMSYQGPSRHEEWMLRKNLDVPIYWSNDIDNISDQPYAPGYPILGPVQDILEETEHGMKHVFRFPKEGELNTRQIDQLIENQGTDALAWYRPFHMDPQEKWGITILDRGIWYVARKIAEGMYSAPYDEEDIIMRCRDIAKDFLYHHEMFHFKVELASTVMEKINPYKPLYAHYWRPQHNGEWFGSEVKSNRQVKAPLEEALANSYALHKVCSEITGKERTKVKNALKQFMKMQPDGYRHAYIFPYNGKRWKTAMYELIDKIENQEGSETWNPQRLIASHVLFDGIDGTDDWIEAHYERVVPCRILDTGFAQGRFSAPDWDFGIWCMSKDFRKGWKGYNGKEKKKFQEICIQFMRCTNDRGLKDKNGYKKFCEEHGESAKYLGTSKWGTHFHYFRFFGKQHRVYHETAASGEEVLLNTHYGGNKTYQNQLIRALEKTTPRPASIVNCAIKCNAKSP